MSKVRQIRFTNRANMKISIPMFFCGIGLMGSRVVNTICQLTDSQDKQYYKGLIINSNEQDNNAQKYVKNHLLLGNGKGAGRNPYIGYQLFQEKEDEIMTKLIQLAEDTKFIWLVAGLGGGTGTGAILEAMDWASRFEEMNIGYGVIVSIPRKANMYVENKNALVVLEQLNEFAANRAIPIIIVDNEQLYNEYLSKRKKGEIKDNVDWTEDSNWAIAGLLHQLNLVTANFDPYSSLNFDGMEYEGVLLAGGCLTFTLTRLTISDFKTPEFLEDKIKKSMEAGLGSSEYDLSEATRAGISVFASSKLANKAFDIVNWDLLETSVQKVIPAVENINWGQYIDQYLEEEILMFSVVSGLGLPKRILNIHDIVKNGKPKATASKLNLALEETKSETKTQIQVKNPFSKANKEKVNPFSDKSKSGTEIAPSSEKNSSILSKWKKH